GKSTALFRVESETAALTNSAAARNKKCPPFLPGSQPISFRRGLRRSSCRSRGRDRSLSGLTLSRCYTGDTWQRDDPTRPPVSRYRYLSPTRSPGLHSHAPLRPPPCLLPP